MKQYKCSMSKKKESLDKKSEATKFIDSKIDALVKEISDKYGFTLQEKTKHDWETSWYLASGNTFGHMADGKIAIWINGFGAFLTLGYKVSKGYSSSFGKDIRTFDTLKKNLLADCDMYFGAGASESKKSEDASSVDDLLARHNQKWLVKVSYDVDATHSAVAPSIVRADTKDAATNIALKRHRGLGYNMKVVSVEPMTESRKKSESKKNERDTTKIETYVGFDELLGYADAEYLLEDVVDVLSKYYTYEDETFDEDQAKGDPEFTIKIEGGDERADFYSEDIFYVHLPNKEAAEELAKVLGGELSESKKSKSRFGKMVEGNATDYDGKYYVDIEDEDEDALYSSDMEFDSSRKASLWAFDELGKCKDNDDVFQASVYHLFINDDGDLDHELVEVIHKSDVCESHKKSEALTKDTVVVGTLDNSSKAWIERTLKQIKKKFPNVESDAFGCTITIRGKLADVSTVCDAYPKGVSSLWTDKGGDFLPNAAGDNLDYEEVGKVLSESKKSEGIGSRIKMGIDYNMFMRMCRTAAYLDEDEDYWDALWEYYSEMGEIEDALVFFDNLFQYTSWKTAEDLWTDYSHILGDKPEGKDYEEALDAYLDENDNEVGNSAVYKYGDHYLMLH